MRFRFFFGEAIDSLVRNWVMSLAGIVTVLVSMFVLGIGTFVFFNVQRAASGVTQKLEIEVFIKNAASQDEINKLGDEIRAMPEVRDMNFVSKDEAMNRLRDSMKGHEDVLQALSGNPLPASYEIFLKDTNQTQEVASRFYDNPAVDNSAITNTARDPIKLAGGLSASATTMTVTAGGGSQLAKDLYIRVDHEIMRVTDNPVGDKISIARGLFGTTADTHADGAGVYSTDGVKTGGKTTERVNMVANYTLIGGSGFVVLLAVASVLLISNTIRLSIFARRREVEIMRLVGATNWFIRWPFVIEGIATGLLGATGAVILVIIVQNSIVNMIKQQLTFLGAEAVPTFWLLLAIIGGGMLLGSVGSALALRRFLKI